MKSLSYTLLSDGSSDRMLMPILDWLLYQHCPEYAVNPNWADLGRLRKPPKTLPDKIRTTLDLYPCDILFIHRDAEKETYDTRYAQITRALEGIESPPLVCVIPVRMQEAWLLFDEKAIRRASGNPNGRSALYLPTPHSVESLSDPKAFLFELIRAASGLHGARLKKLDPYRLVFRVSQYIDDFSLLRMVNAFDAMERLLENVLIVNGWKIGLRVARNRSGRG